MTSSSRVSAQVAVPWKPVLSVDTGQLQLASCCIASGPSEQLAVSLSTVVQLVAGGAIVTSQIAWLGISATELACFVGFWGLQVKLVCCHISAGLNGPNYLLIPTQQPLLQLPLPPQTHCTACAQAHSAMHDSLGLAFHRVCGTCTDCLVLHLAGLCPIKPKHC